VVNSYAAAVGFILGIVDGASFCFELKVTDAELGTDIKNDPIRKDYTDALNTVSTSYI
jgi:hypothetical protein